MLDASTSRVLTMSVGGRRVTVRATIPDVFPCLLTLGVQPCEAGLQNQPVSLSAVVVDNHGTIYVADAGQGIIWRLRPTHKAPEVWYSSSDVDTGDGPAGLAFDRRGRLLFTTGSSIDTANPNNGGLYQLTVTSTGAAGSRTLLHSFASGERPGAVVVGASGTSYVIARGPGAIVSIDKTGKELGRVTSPGDGPVALDTPAGLALTRGRLLVTNEAPLAPENWAVLAIAVNDRPQRTH
jgi:streptogramin lyase